MEKTKEEHQYLYLTKDDQVILWLSKPKKIFEENIDGEILKYPKGIFVIDNSTQIDDKFCALWLPEWYNKKEIEEGQVVKVKLII